jgi:CheY-like chemotaxis protein
MYGITAGKIIRGDLDTKNIKMIAVTSFAMSGDKIRFLRADFSHYMAKPSITETSGSDQGSAEVKKLKTRNRLMGAGLWKK